MFACFFNNFYICLYHHINVHLTCIYLWWLSKFERAQATSKQHKEQQLQMKPAARYWYYSGFFFYFKQNQQQKHCSKTTTHFLESEHKNQGQVQVQGRNNFSRRIIPSPLPPTTYLPTPSHFYNPAVKYYINIFHTVIVAMYTVPLLYSFFSFLPPPSLHAPLLFFASRPLSLHSTSTS